MNQNSLSFNIPTITPHAEQPAAPDSKPVNSRAAELEAIIGPRSSNTPMPSSLRNLLRKWIAAKTGKPATACLDLTMPEFSGIYRDTTDAKLNAWAGKPEPVKPAPISTEQAPSGTHTSAETVTPGAIEKAILAAITKSRPALDEERVRDIASEEAATIVNNAVEALRPKVTSYAFNNGLPPVEFKGIQHRKMPLLMAVLSARLPNGNRINPLLVGPAGTGKTHSSELAIKATTDKDAEVLGASMTKTDVLGYEDGHGVYHSTPITRAFVEGKGVIADEIDSWFPAATLAMNAVNANGLLAIGGGMAKRNPDYVCVGGANTNLTGGSSQYVRMKQDGAAADRFFFIKWEHDNALEAALVGVEQKQEGFDLADGGIRTPAEWVERVQAVRAAVEKLKLDYIISTRATLYGVALFAQGVGSRWVEEGTLFRQMNDGDKALVLKAVGGK